MDNEQTPTTSNRLSGARLPLLITLITLPAAAALLIWRLSRREDGANRAASERQPATAAPNPAQASGVPASPITEQPPRQQNVPLSAQAAPQNAPPIIEKPVAARALPLWARNIALVLFGLMLPLVIAALLLRDSGPVSATAASPLIPTVQGPCQAAPEPFNWYLNVNGLVDGYHMPCLQRQWGDTQSEFFVEIHHNNYGLHDALITLAKPAGVFRVLILGDSFPQGWEVPLEQGFPWLLEGYLSTQTNRPIEVINLSIHAYGTDSELLLYSALGWQFDADLVILSFYTGNDIRDNEINLEQLQYGYRLQRAFFTLDANGELQLHNKRDTNNLPIQFDRALYPDSPAWQWLTTMQAANAPAPEYIPPPAPRVTGEPPNYQVAYPVDMGLYVAQNPADPAYEVWENAWTITEKLIVQLRDLVEAQGSRFAILIIPDRRAVHTSDWEALVARYPDLLADADPRLPPDRVEQIATAHGILALNLTGTMRSWTVTHSADQRLYYIGDGHFNAAGHQLTAETLAEWLLANALVP